MRVLIVDDEPSARITLEALLFPEGYELTLATSGLVALDLLDQFKPDTILLDVMMPEMDGFAVCQQLKAHKLWRHIPVILVTALDSKEDLVRGLEAGADEFLSKPVNGFELRARVRSMLRIKKQYDELAATMRLREDLTSMMVHDMKNLLSPIMGFSQLLTVNSTTLAEAFEYGELINSQADRLSSFINDILLLTKMEQGRLLLNTAPVDINSLVREVGLTYEVVAQSKEITLAVDLPPVSRQVVVDKNLLQRLLDNLVSNALKFAPLKSTVTLQVEYPPVSARRSQRENVPLMRAKVIDEGPGIAAEYRHRIFEKFETLALKKSGVLQVGLGLAFCKMVAEAHGGRVFVEDNQPAGSIFVVEI
ncbi:MAG: response regulator [Anaerolineae bacterium]|nr:response regulator [Anaerolineae bacterium]